MVEIVKVYVASRASVPARVKMWHEFRDRGAQIISTWIDESGPGETDDFSALWYRLHGEIICCDRLVFYAAEDDLPLKGALVEVGIALALHKPVWVMGNVTIDEDTLRPIGSWIKHPGVQHVNLQCGYYELANAVGANV